MSDNHLDKINKINEVNFFSKAQLEEINGFTKEQLDIIINNIDFVKESYDLIKLGLNINECVTILNLIRNQKCKEENASICFWDLIHNKELRNNIDFIKTLTVASEFDDIASLEAYCEIVLDMDLNNFKEHHSYVVDKLSKLSNSDILYELYNCLTYIILLETDYYKQITDLVVEFKDVELLKIFNRILHNRLIIKNYNFKTILITAASITDINNLINFEKMCIEQLSDLNLSAITEKINNPLLKDYEKSIYSSLTKILILNDFDQKQKLLISFDEELNNMLKKINSNPYKNYVK